MGTRVSSSRRANSSPLSLRVLGLVLFSLAAACSDEVVYDDIVEPVREATQLAKRGDAGGQYMLGIMYANGQRLPQDDEKAVYWLRKSAKQGFPDAQLMLERLYEEGRGVRPNAARAVKWYRKAAEQEVAHAYAFLGRMYSDGRGVPQDFSIALQWYRKASERGVGFGSYLLGAHYEWGPNVARDDDEAFRWHTLAISQLDPGAHEALERFRFPYAYTDDGVYRLGP